MLKELQSPESVADEQLDSSPEKTEESPLPVFIQSVPAPQKINLQPSNPQFKSTHEEVEYKLKLHKEREAKLDPDNAAKDND